MRRKSLLSAILSGVALPATVYSTHAFPRMSGSDLDRMRGDVQRIGNDFRKVIDRENGKKATASRRQTL